jgi:hypothetical protein
VRFFVDKVKNLCGILFAVKAVDKPAKRQPTNGKQDSAARHGI